MNPRGQREGPLLWEAQVGVPRPSLAGRDRWLGDSLLRHPLLAQRREATAHGGTVPPWAAQAGSFAELQILSPVLGEYWRGRHLVPLPPPTELGRQWPLSPPRQSAIALGVERIGRAGGRGPEGLAAFVRSCGPLCKSGSSQFFAAAVECKQA